MASMTAASSTSSMSALYASEGRRSEHAAADVVRHWTWLGWTAFGGPTAHLALFEKVFVQSLGWFSAANFAELVAVASALPGPTSTQVSFAAGLVRGEGSIACGILSGLLFQYPGLFLMAIVGSIYAKLAPHALTGAARATSLGGAAAGVALVFLAVRSLAKKVCKGQRQASIAVVVAAIGILQLTSAGVLYPLMIVGGGVAELLGARLVMYAKMRKNSEREDTLIAISDDATMRDGLLISRGHETAAADECGAHEAGGDNDAGRQVSGLVSFVDGGGGSSSEHLHGVSLGMGAVLLSIWAIVLMASLVSVKFIAYETAPAVHWFSTFYKAGSLTFGGGHVVLPLLMDDITGKQTHLVTNCTSGILHANDAIGSTYLHLNTTYASDMSMGAMPSNSTTPDACGWVTTEQFLFGLAVVQAMPGPLFNLSAFLGAVMAIRAHVNIVVGIAAAWVGLFSPGILLIFAASAFWSRARNIAVYKDMLPGMNAAAVGLIMIACYTMYTQVSALSPRPGISTALGLVAAAAIDIYAAPAPLVIVTGSLLSLGLYLLGLW